MAPGSEVEKYYDGVFTLENDTPLETNEQAYRQFLERFESTEFLDVRYSLYLSLKLWIIPKTVNYELSLKLIPVQGEAESLKLYLAYMYNSIVAWATAYKKTGDTADTRSTKYEDIILQLTDLTYDGEFKTLEYLVL